MEILKLLRFGKKLESWGNDMEDKWISVNDRLPSDDCRLIAATWFKLDGEQHIEICGFRSGSGKFDYTTTHWQPLPDPPNKTKMPNNLDTVNEITKLTAQVNQLREALTFIAILSGNPIGERRYDLIWEKCNETLKTITLKQPPEPPKD